MMAASFFVPQKELKKMNIYTNVPEKRTSCIPVRQIYSVAEPQDTEKCRGCRYSGVGFICWDQDGSCMKTDVEKIYDKLRSRR